MRVWIALAVALVLLGMGASYYYIEERLPAPAGTVLAASDTPSNSSKGHFSVLMLGVDERSDDVGRSDTIMLGAVDLDNSQVRLLSIPRDTYVHIPGHGYDKINAAYAYGKEQLSKQTLEGFLGVPIDHYIVINLQGFQKVVEALGGVTINIEEDMDYDDPYDEPPLHIHLKKGVQHLDPVQAMGYVRFRHDAESDFGRARRQQQMLKALAQEALRPANLLKLPQVISAAYGAVRTDLSSSQVLQLGLLAKGWSAGSNAIVTEGTPQAEDYWHDGVAYLKLDLMAVRTQVYKMLTGQDPTPDFLAKVKQDEQTYLAAFVPDKPAPPEKPQPTPATPAKPAPGNSKGGSGGSQPAPGQPQPTPRQQWSVSVVDASGKNASLQAVPELNEAGLRVVSVARAKTPMPGTLVIVHSADASLRQLLQELFPRAQFMVQPASRDAETPVEIVLGADLGPAPGGATSAGAAPGGAPSGGPSSGGSASGSSSGGATSTGATSSGATSSGATPGGASPGGATSGSAAGGATATGNSTAGHGSTP